MDVSVEQEVQKLEARIVEAFLRNDWNALAALYAEDAVLMPPNAPPVRGARAISDFFSSSPLTLTKFETRSEGVQSEAGLVINRGTYALSFTMSGTSGTDEGKYLWVLRRSLDGAWRIAIDMFSSNRPAQ